MKLKQEFANKMIFIHNIRQSMLGKFIPVGLYPSLYKKYPEFFEVETKNKSKKQDVIPIDNTIKITNNNTTDNNKLDTELL